MDTNQILTRETKVWHSLSHENVVNFLGLCCDVGPSPAMISPLYNKGHVFQYLVYNPQEDRLKIVNLGSFCVGMGLISFISLLQIVGIACGLKYLHLRNIVHGDVKGVST